MVRVVVVVGCPRLCEMGLDTPQIYEKKVINF